MESMVMVDQLNAPALQSAELISRRLQLIEEARRLSPSAPDYSSADHFMGWTSRKHGAIVLPALAAHVATTMRDEAAISKAARKARKEMKLKRTNPKGAGRGAKGADGE